MSRLLRAKDSSGLMLSAEGSRARTFPTPDSGQDLTESEADFSLKPFAWFDNSDPGSLSWKTWQRCLLGGWTEFSGRWPRSGTMRNGIVYRLHTLAHRISGTEFSYWPTPSAKEPGISADRIVDKHGNKPEHPNQRLYDKITGRLVQDGLSQAVKLWPTPRANDAEKRGNIANDKRNGLPAAVMHWPTPTATMHKGSSQNALTRKDGKDRLDHKMQSVEGNGQLNPQWVEWLMGFPIGWTDLED